MQSKSSAKDVIIGFIILICLLIYAVAAVVAAFKVFGWLMERSSMALCLSIHGVVAASGLLLWLLPDGWWLWIAGAPFVAWAVVVGVVALPVFWSMIASWISGVARQFG